MKLKLSDYAKMSEEEKTAALKKLVDAAQAPPKEETIAEWKAKVACYEKQYEMSSDEMRRLLSNGEIFETHEICKWLMDLHVLERLNKVG